MNEEEVNAAELIFGDEFDFEESGANNLKCLTNDQVYFLLSSAKNTGSASQTE
jgi:hypothetical protein